MNEYCIFAQYYYYEYTCLHSSACIAPARDSPLFSNEPALPQTTGADFVPPPVANINPSKTGGAPSDAASPPENPRGGDGPTGDACESTSGTNGSRTASMYEPTFDTHMLGEICGPRGSSGFRTASMHEVTFYTHMFGEICGPRTSEEDLRGRDRSRCSTVLQPVRPEGHLAVLLRRSGILAELMVHQGGELSPRDLLFGSQDFPGAFFSLEPRPNPSSSRQVSRHTDPT